MFDIANLFISQALAADVAAPVVAPAVAAASSDNGLIRFLPLFLIFIVFYFLLIRPQQKKLDEQNQLLKALKKGDKVVTGGGLVGVITKVDGDEYVTVEIAKDVQVKALRSTINGLAPEAKPATEAKKN